MDDLIKIDIINRDDSRLTVEVPNDMSISLMELLKAMDYHILATCGGMALCATCHVEVQEGFDQLPEPSDDEWQMLDTLPKLTQTSRLSCQIKAPDLKPGMAFKILGDTQE